MKDTLHSDEYFMRYALDEAEKAYETGEVPVGAVVVHDNMVIAKAHNLTEKLRDATAHAEMQAITAAAYKLGSKYLKNCTLYVTVEPCTMCAGALHWAQIDRIVYGVTDEKKGYHKYSNNLLSGVREIKSGVLATEAKQLIQKFFRQLRK
ncbi:MAG: nucleoside deaminase [Bacteroidota bacterium]|nr:nucleoside deaminase [Bacteroidota bacterium]